MWKVYFHSCNLGMAATCSLIRTEARKCPLPTEDRRAIITSRVVTWLGTPSARLHLGSGEHVARFEASARLGSHSHSRLDPFLPLFLPATPRNNEQRSLLLAMMWSRHGSAVYFGCTKTENVHQGVSNNYRTSPRTPAICQPRIQHT